MAVRPPHTQPDLFAATPDEMPLIAKKASPKAKHSCAQCVKTYCTVQEVANRYRVFRSTVWRWLEKEPDFPKPVKLTLGTTRWLLSDLVRFEQAQKNRSNKKRHKEGGY